MCQTGVVVVSYNNLQFFFASFQPYEEINSIFDGKSENVNIFTKHRRKFSAIFGKYPFGNFRI